METYTQPEFTMARPKQRPPQRLQTVEQPRHPGVSFVGQDGEFDITRDLKPSPKPHAQQTFTERWIERRKRVFRVIPTRLSTLDKGFGLLLQVADRETYELTSEEAERIVARFRAWCDALEVSLGSGKPLLPSDLPVIAFSKSLAPPAEDTIAAPEGLEDIWGPADDPS